MNNTTIEHMIQTTLDECTSMNTPPEALKCWIEAGKQSPETVLSHVRGLQGAGDEIGVRIALRDLPWIHREAGFEYQQQQKLAAEQGGAVVEKEESRATPVAKPEQKQEEQAEAMPKEKHKYHSRGMAMPLTGCFNSTSREFLKRYESKILNPPKPLVIAKDLEIYPEDKLIIVGAMPGTGKTALMSSNSAIELMQQGAHVVIVNYEMIHEGSMNRLISCASFTSDTPIELNDIKRGTAAMGNMTEVVNTIFNLPGSISYIKPADPKELDLYLTNLRSECPDGPMVVIYDYLQRMPWFDEGDPRQNTKMTLRKVQEIADKFGNHSIVIASINRTGYGEADLSVFKEAGEIESDADIAVVLTFGEYDGQKFCNVPKERLAEVRRQEEVMIIVNVLKERNGQEKRYALNFVKKYQAFELLDFRGKKVESTAATGPKIINKLDGPTWDELIETGARILKISGKLNRDQQKQAIEAARKAAEPVIEPKPEVKVPRQREFKLEPKTDALALYAQHSRGEIPSTTPPVSPAQFAMRDRIQGGHNA